MTTFGPGARNGPGWETKPDDEGAGLTLPDLFFGLLFMGQFCPLKMAQDIRKRGRGLKLVTKGGNLVVCKVASKDP